MAAVLGWTIRAREAERRLLLFALLASIGLHLAILLGLPQFIEAQRKALFPGPLTARLSPPPAKPQAEAPRQEPVAGPPRIARPAAVPAKPAPATREVARSEPAAAAAAPQPAAAAIDPAPSPAAPAASAKAESHPTAPAPAFDEVGTIAQYRIALMDVARGLKTYPRIAQENNWQGRVELRMSVGPGGALASLAVKSGTGYAVLDQHALDMIRRAQPRTPLPAGLRGREFTIEVPVIFGLKVD